MHDATPLFTTLAQVSGGFVAIISGFIISRLLATESERERLRQKYQTKNNELDEIMSSEGLGADDFLKPVTNPKLKKFIKDSDDLALLAQIANDSRSTRRAFLHLVPICVFGLALPLGLLASGHATVSIKAQVLIFAAFLSGVITVFAFMIWYAWDIHSRL